MLNSFLYKVCEWIMRFAYLNILWIVFSFLGFIFAGIFPATVAMFTVLRKWVMKQTDTSIFHTFYQAYKREWLKSNLYGIVVLSFAAFIFMEYTIINEHSHFLLQFSKYPLLLLVLLFSFLLLYGFPTYVHYEGKLFQIVKNSLLISLVNPFWTVVMVLSLTMIFSLLHILPSLSLFFGASVSSFVIMWCCYQGFLNVQEKQAKRKPAMEN